MSPEQYQRLSGLFAQAVALPDGEQASFARKACAGEPELADELLAMLAADEGLMSRLEQSGVSDAASAALRAVVEGSPAGARAGAEAPPARIGRYRVLRVLAAGGMGVVYEAEQDAPRRSVALKLLRSTLSSRQALRRFHSEVQMMARLRHPGIAQIYEAGSSADADALARPYFAMEFIEDALPITEFCAQRRLPVRERLELLAQICDAVHHGHQRGIIHRDLKPTNLLVGGKSLPPAPKVIDFGVARATEEDSAQVSVRTEAGQIIGTVQYMSPEQVTGSASELDARSDVYSLGVVLFEVLSGQAPYDVSSTGLIGAAKVISEAPPARLGELNHACRGEIEIIVGKALAKEREARYQSASELGADLRRYLAGEPILAKPPTLIYTLRKLAGRNKAAAASAIVAALAIVVGAAASILWGVEAGRARAVADRQREAAEVQALRASLVAAGASLRENDAGEAARLLQDVPANQRAWEWRHLASRLDQSLWRQPHQEGSWLDVQFGRDGQRLFVMSRDGERARTSVWNVPQRRLERVFDQPGAERISPSTSGELVAWIERPRGDLVVARVVDAAELRRVPGYAGMSIVLPDDSGDAGVVLRAVDAQRVRLDEPATDSCASGWIRPCFFQVRLSIAPERACVNDGSNFFLTDLSVPQRPRLTFTHPADCWQAAFDPTGRLLATACSDSRVALWDVATQKPADWGSAGDAIGPQKSVDFSPDGSLIASGGQDGLIRLWNAASGQPAGALRGHTSVVAALRFAHDGKSLASVSLDGTTRLWSLDQARREGLVGEHALSVRSAHWLPPQPGEPADRVISCGNDGFIRIWSVKDRSIVREINIRPPTAPFCPLNDFQIDRDGRRAWFTLWAAGIRQNEVWREPWVLGEVDIEKGEVTRWIRPADRSRMPFWTAYIPAAASGAGELGEGLFLGDFSIAPNPPPQRVFASILNFSDFSPRFEFASPNLLSEAPALLHASVSPSGDLVATTTPGLAVEVWNTRTGAPVATLALDAPPNLVQFNADGSLLAAGGAAGVVELWNTKDWTRFRRLATSSGQASALAFSPDGARLALDAADRTIRIWDPLRAVELATLRGHGGAVTSLEFSPDGRTLLSAGADGQVRVWHAPDRIQVGAQAPSGKDKPER